MSCNLACAPKRQLFHKESNTPQEQVVRTALCIQFFCIWKCWKLFLVRSVGVDAHSVAPAHDVCVVLSKWLSKIKQRWIKCSILKKISHWKLKRTSKTVSDWRTKCWKTKGLWSFCVFASMLWHACNLVPYKEQEACPNL